MSHGDYPLERRIGSGITMQDKEATAERNPFCLAPALARWHAQSAKVDYFSIGTRRAGPNRGYPGAGRVLASPIARR